MVNSALTGVFRRSFRPTVGRQVDCDVFINHRGTDTKRTVASLLYKHLKERGFCPFLDNKSMKPGDRLFEKIDPAIKNCKVAVAIFSENYGDSYFCLHELALMMECGKKVVPIFCDIKPSDLKVVDNEAYSAAQLERFNKALEEAKNTIGLAFDLKKCDWTELLDNITDAIIDAMAEDNQSKSEKKPTLPAEPGGYSQDDSVGALGRKVYLSKSI